jgi:hypothetical protein
MKKIKNFSRFYALLNKAVGADKEELVRQFTGGRTASLREMTPQEYNEMCDRLQGGTRSNGWSLSRYRHEALSALSAIGIIVIDKDFSQVNQFCLKRSRFKKLFYDFDIKDLKALRRQAEAIRMKAKAKPKRYANTTPILITSTPIYA